MDLRNHGIGALQTQRPTTWVGETPYPKASTPTQPHVGTMPEISDLLKSRYFFMKPFNFSILTTKF